METARWIEYWVVDVFTDQPFRGNSAGVVLDAGNLPAETMRLIARELGSPETAFADPFQRDGPGLRLRWFTATCEVPFSGHATLAALHVLAETGRHTSSDPLTLEMLSGTLRGWPTGPRGEGHPEMEVPLPQLEAAPFGREDLVAALLSPPEILAAHLPLLRDGLTLLVPCASPEALLNLRPDFRRLSRLGLEHDITSFVCFSHQGPRGGPNWNLRLFAPGIGIAEDPVSGSAHAAVCAYLLAQGLIDTPAAGEGTWIGGQGDNLDRRGQVQVQIAFDNRGQPAQVCIGGSAITVMRGHLRIV